MYKLFPILLNLLFGFYLIVNIRSPLARSITYSPSLSNKIVSPLAAPLFMSISIILLSYINLFPLHLLHFEAIVVPLPPHYGQGCCIYIYIIPIFTICKTTPYPLHFGHVFSLPSFAPDPRHESQYIFLFIFILRCVPTYISSRVIWISALADGPF